MSAQIRPRHRIALLLAAAATFALPALTTPVAAKAATGQQCQPSTNKADPAVPWPQAQLASDQVWPLTKGSGVTVAVLDTGVSRSAAALRGRVAAGQDVTAKGSADTDCAGHGTFVAGLIAAHPVVGSGFTGIAPDVNILPIRVIAADQSNRQDIAPDTLAAGINAAVDGGASVIATPATAPYGSAALTAAVARAVQRQVLIVAPATTTRNQTGDVAMPASLPGVLSVAGVDRSGTPVIAIPPSSPPSLCAPANDLTSVPPAGAGTIQGSGQALAVGYVAGAAALVHAYRPDLSAEQLRRRLMDTANPIAGATAAALVGSGMINPTAAVTADLPAAGIAAPSLAPRSALDRPVQQQPVDRSAAKAANRWSVLVLGLTVLVGLLATVISRGRRRDWSTRALTDRSER